MSRSSASDKIESVNSSGSDESRYSSLKEFIDASGFKRYHVAGLLGVSNFRLSQLQKPEVYHPHLSDDLIERIAKLINAPLSEVRSFYEQHYRRRS